jgi:serine/threonine protein kinase
VLRPGQTFADYVIDAVLGAGGSATVYRAHEKADRRHLVALKVLDDHHRVSPELTRLKREFEFARRVHHPHVVAVERHGAGWLSMQLLGGGHVATLPTLAQRLTALTQIAAALDYVHSCGIIHCDVKPTNILVGEAFCGADAVLIDFGVAHALAEDAHRKRPLQIRASLPYLAPELLRGQMPTAVTDEYALACTTVELVTGSPPFVAGTSRELIDAQLHAPPPRVSPTLSWVPRAFDSILQTAMAKDREERYQTCTELMSMVTKVLR